MELIRKSLPGEEVLQENDYTLADGTALPLLQFPKLAETGMVMHGFTTREGGVSTGYLSSLNFSTTRGDSPETVRRNFARVAEAFGTDESHFVLTKQVHHTNVYVVDESLAGCGVTRPGAFTDCDGLVTNVPGIIIGAFVADCVPVLFVDPVHRAIGACHSGWKGTVGRISRVTIDRMREAFGTNPADLVCGIGPSICKEHYEVSDDVADQFRSEFPGHEDEIMLDKHNGHALLDLWAAVKITLREAGVPDSQISVTDICTACNPDKLFSHRASQGKCGNIAGFIMLADQENKKAD